MNLNEYKIIFISVGLIGILLIATPALAELIQVPGEEPFSELYILGPEHMASNYPYNIYVNHNYSVYLDVGNHLGSSAYYTVYLKLLNQTDKPPNATTGMPSPVLPIYEYRLSVEDNQTVEYPLDFSINFASTSANQSVINKMTINENIFNVNKTSVLASNMTKSNYQLFFELWLYNSTSNSFEYNNRSIHMLLNLTKT
jgi:uncharacterized membrane protein